VISTDTQQIVEFQGEGLGEGRCWTGYRQRPGSPTIATLKPRTIPCIREFTELPTYAKPGGAEYWLYKPEGGQRMWDVFEIPE
jgi:hypothetical protein